MLNYRIRCIYYSTTKRCYFDSILSVKSVSKKMHHLSFRALANDVYRTESQPNVLLKFDCINEILRLCISLKTIFFVIEKLPFRPYLLCSKPVKPGHYSVIPSHILSVLLTKYGKMA